MSIKVVTISNCELCGVSDTRDGAEGYVPPVDWWRLNLARRDEGSGWTNNYQIEKILCPQCADKVIFVLGELPQ